MITPNATTFRLPNGLLINNADGVNFTTPWDYGTVYMTSFGTGNASKTNSLQENDSLIWAMSILRMLPPADSSSVWPNTPLEAVECGLFYCVNQYSPRVENRVLYEVETRVDNAARDSDSWQPMSVNGKHFGKTFGPGFVCDAGSIKSIEYSDNNRQQPRSDLMFGDNFNVSQTAVSV